MAPPNSPRDSSVGASRCQRPHRDIDQWEDDMKNMIDAIQTNGEPVVMKHYPEYPLPGLQIGGVPITLPLQLDQTWLFSNACQRLVSTNSAQAIWELGPSKFSVSNPAWDRFIKTTVKDVSDSLGIIIVNTKLHKLILHGEGSHTQKYDDSKALTGTAITLAICLPTECKGGEMQFTYDGRIWTFDASQNPYDTSVLAWFSDIAYEIKPITQGLRLTLVYHLLLSENSINSALVPTEQTLKLNHLMAETRTLQEFPQKKIYLLAHTYPNDCLGQAHLKGRDRNVCQALRQACFKNGYHLFLCNIAKKCLHPGEWHRSHPDCDDDGSVESWIECGTIVTWDGRVLSHRLIVNRWDVLGEDVYSSRDPDTSCRDDQETGSPSPEPHVRYEYHDSVSLSVGDGAVHLGVRSFVDVDTNKAIMMVPKEKLWLLTSFGNQIDIDAFLDFIDTEINAHPGDSWTIKGASLYFARAKNDSFRLKSRATKLAWESKDDELFQEIVGTCFHFEKKPHADVIRCLLNTFHEVVSTGIGASETMGALKDYTSGIAELIGLVDSLRSVYFAYDMFASRRDTGQYQADAIKPSEDEFNFACTGTLKWPDADALTNLLVPKLESCGSYRWLSKFIVFLFQRSREEWYEEPKRRVFSLLENLKQNLAAAGTESSNSSLLYNNSYKHALFFERFSKCLLSKLEKAVDGLQQIDYRNWSTEESNEVLLYVCEELQKSTMAPSEAMKNFIIARLQEKNKLTLPRKLESYVRLRNRCWRRTCQACDELKKFLVSPFASRVTFTLEPKTCAHLKCQLPYGLFKLKERCFSHTHVIDGTSRKMVELEVVKLNTEYKFAVDQFQVDLDKLVKRMQMYRSEYLQEHLGDKLYDELITFDTLLKSQAGLAGNGVTAGRKRKAQESVDQSAAKK
ncbi:hypothetical protein GGR57DRAFT_517770 [Xylariaceae sp. FL1272]|nr:hypothetical protein GGR57DRAFT_517770 [Xylariaceae sp. FL1272]